MTRLLPIFLTAALVLGVAGFVLPAEGQSPQPPHFVVVVDQSAGARPGAVAAATRAVEAARDARAELRITRTPTEQLSVTGYFAARGYDVVGADSAPAALDRAREIAAARGVEASFVEADALDPAGLRGFDTVLDSALFHIFDTDDQARYADALRDVVVDGGRVVLLGLAPGPAFGPEVTDDEIRTAFSLPGWVIEEVRESTYRGRVPDEAQADLLGVPVGGNVDLPAWLAIACRT